MRATVELAALEVECKVEVFPNGHIQIKRRLLREVSNQLFGADGIAENINARNACLARGGGKISRKDIHSGTLARTVGTEKTDDFAFFYGKADIVYRTGGAVIFYKMLNFNHERVVSFLDRFEATVRHINNSNYILTYIYGQTMNKRKEIFLSGLIFL
jgi:hypothetical protein